MDVKENTLTNIFYTSIIQFVILGVKEMKWTLKEIQDHRDEPLHFTETVDLEKSLMKRDKQILAVSEITADGYLLYDNHAVMANFTVDLTITLPSSRSLEPVAVPMNIQVSEVYVEDESSLDAAHDIEEIVIPLEGKDLDLIPAVEDAILLNLPIQVLTKEEAEAGVMPSGADWAVMSEDDYRKQKEKEKEEFVDPRFAGLKSLLDDEEQKDS